MERVDLEQHLEDHGDGWQWTPEIVINEQQFVDDPSRFRDGMLGRIFGPARVTLKISRGSRTLVVREV